MLQRVLGLALGMVLWCGVAHAEGPRRDSVAQEHWHWYGAPTVAADVAAIGMTGAGFMTLGYKTDVLAPIGLGAFALSGPVVHVVHGNYGRAALSLLTRVTVPVASILGVGAVDHSLCSDRSCYDGIAVGMAGMALASMLDAGLMSWERVPEKAPKLAPILGVSKGTAFVGAAGVF